MVIGNPIVLSSTDYTIYANGYDDIEEYSTTEVKTNKVWIDGKPIYRKVLSATNKGTFSSIVFDETIDTVDMVVSAFGYLKCTTGTYAGRQYNVPRVSEEIGVVTSTGVVTLNNRDTDVNADYVAVIVEYTKTTD